MSIESAIYVADLQPLNPPSTDPRSQGDDHLRLIKTVLQNTFSGASRQWQVPNIRFTTTSYSIVKADGESTFIVDTTSGVVTLTLPTLTAGDAGWKTYVMKSNTGPNPVFIAPPSGSINSGGFGVTSARRSIPGARVAVVWIGSQYIIERAVALPVGSCVEFHGSVLPAGYEWPNGQTLSSAANYPEYNAATGGNLTTLDKRGRIGVALDNLGGAAAGRLPNGVINGTAVGNTGGNDAVILNATQLPAHQHAVFLKENPHTHGHNAASNIGGSGTPGPFTAPLNPPGAATINAASTGITIGSVAGVANDNQTATNTGGGGSHSNLQPSIMVSQILVVE